MYHQRSQTCKEHTREREVDDVGPAVHSVIVWIPLHNCREVVEPEEVKEKRNKRSEGKVGVNSGERKEKKKEVENSPLTR